MIFHTALRNVYEKDDIYFFFILVNLFTFYLYIGTIINNSANY